MKVTLGLTALLVFVAFFETADAAISAWDPPTINSASGNGALTVKEDQETSTAFETLAVTGTGTTAFTLLTSDTPFDVATGGALTITTSLDFETTPGYSIEVRAVDDDSTATATISITVEDVNEAPTFAAATYSVCVEDGLTADTSVYAVTATDQDSGNTITYSIAAGDTNSEFKVSGSEIQVNTGKALDRATTESYVLRFEAADSASTSLTGTTTVSVTVGECSMATRFAVSIVTLLLSLVTALNSF